MHALLLTLALSVTPTTWVVGPAGVAGVNFQTIQEAVDAAASGDLVVVLWGNYPAFNLVGKGLTIIGTGPSATFVSGAHIGPCAPDQPVYIENLRIGTDAITNFYGAFINHIINTITTEPSFKRHRNDIEYCNTFFFGHPLPPFLLCR